MGKGQIFLDTQRVSSRSSYITQRFHRGRKHPEPVVRGDRAWERGGASLYGNVIHESGRFRMWYYSRDPSPRDTGYTCYAESSDGIHWEKPELGLVSVRGSKRNNIAELHLENASVVLDARSGDPHRRYKAFGYIRHPGSNERWGTVYPRTAYYTAHSADGLVWTPDPGGPQIDLRWDEGRMAWDGPRGRYIASVKKDHPYAFHDRRSVTISVSDDAVRWSDPRLMLVPDELDDRLAQARGFAAADFYGLCFCPRDELLVGFLWVHEMWPPFHPTRTLGIFSRVHVQLAYSYDGFVWHRPTGRLAFLDVGERGAFDAGSVYTAHTAIEVGDELWIYYTGARSMHGYALDPQDWRNPRPDLTDGDLTDEMAIGLVTMKKDRFASLSCDDEGNFVVQHGPPGGHHLYLNARTGRGQVRVQVERPDGTPVPGLMFADCLPFEGDNVSAELSWRAASVVDLDPDQPIALRFGLRDADIFAYRIED
jgi:hypothetical protein